MRESVEAGHPVEHRVQRRTNLVLLTLCLLTVEWAYFSRRS